jgi:4'-phosphopantetheinyl transferase
VTEWSIPVAAPALPPDAVHVWIAGLDCSPALLRTHWDTLSQAEQERAGRFRFQYLQDRFVAAHGILRDILSRYLDTEPRSIAMDTDDAGKPFLVPGAAHSDLEFNLSHSDTLAACALTRARRVGVDVELVRPIPERESIATHYFTPPEQAFIQGETTEAARSRAFYICWTRKEAYIKAVGRGLSIPLPSFDTSIAPGAAGRSLPCETGNAAEWRLTDLPPIADHAGAVAVEGIVQEYAYWQWTFQSQPRTP